MPRLLVFNYWVFLFLPVRSLKCLVCRCLELVKSMNWHFKEITLKSILKNRSVQYGLWDKLKLTHQVQEYADILAAFVTMHLCGGNPVFFLLTPAFFFFFFFLQPFKVATNLLGHCGYRCCCGQAQRWQAASAWETHPCGISLGFGSKSVCPVLGMLLSIWQHNPWQRFHFLFRCPLIL